MACRYRDVRRSPMKMKYFRHCLECRTEFSTNDSRRIYCSPSCERKHAAKKFKAKYRAEHKVLERTCKQCGKLISVETQQRKYCSAECRAAWTQEHKQSQGKMKDPCPVCGRSVPPGRRKYCSKLCLELSYGNRKAPDGWIPEKEAGEEHAAFIARDGDTAHIIRDADIISEMFSDAIPALQASAGWGCIEVRSARQKPAGPAKIRIPASRLPDRGKPTKDVRIGEVASGVDPDGNYRWIRNV